MSRIHRALQNTGTGQNSRRTSGFNPLTGKTKTGNSRIGYYGLSGLMLAAAAVVFLWPSAESLIESAQSVDKNEPPLTQQQPPAETETPSEAVITDIEASDVKPETMVIAPQVDTEPVQIQPAAKVAQNTQTPPAPESQDTAVSTVEPENEKIEQPVRTQNSIPGAAEPKLPSIAKTEALKAPQAVPAVTPSQPEAEAVAASNPTIQPVRKTSEPQLPQQSVIKTSQAHWQSQVESSIQSGNIEKAEAQLKQWITASPKDDMPRIWLARIYINNGFYKAAEPLLTDQTSTDAKALNGIIFEKTGRPALASKVFEDLFRADTGNHRWLLFWAVNTENSQQLVKARTLYQNYLDRFAAIDPSLTHFAQQRVAAIGGAL